MSEVKNVEVFLEDVTLLWTYLAERDDNDKFRVTCRLDKDNDKHMDIRDELFKAIDKVTDEAIDKLPGWKGKAPDSILNTVNGDDSDYDFEHGAWLLAAATKLEVPLVYGDRSDVDPKDIKREFYNGVRANVYVRVYAIDGKYKGVYCSLEAIQKVADGPKIGGGGGGVDPKKVFKDVGGGRRSSRDDRDSRDDRGRDSRDSRDDRGSRDRGRDDRDSRDDRGRGRDDDRGRRDDRDDRGSRRDDRDDRSRGRDDRDDRGRDDRDSRDDRSRGRDDRDDDRGGRRGGRDDDDDRGSSRGRDDDYDRGRERGRDRF